MRLAEIHVYPLKGARGVALERADVLPGGLRHDRRFMLLDAGGAFLTQRTHPTLALLATALDAAAGTLTLSTAAGSAVVPLAPDGPRRKVRCWDDDVDAIEVVGDAAALVAQHLGEPCTLVFMPDDVVRPVEAPYGKPGDRVGFADAYPVLLAARASLDDLNARLAAPVAMSRFRPNLVVDGGAAFEEDRHARVGIGAATFRMPKRCSRCQVVLVDQLTGVVGKEPLRTLAAYRTEANSVYFAQNLIPDASAATITSGASGALAEIAVGDPIAYLERLL